MMERFSDLWVRFVIRYDQLSCVGRMSPPRNAVSLNRQRRHPPPVTRSAVSVVIGDIQNPLKWAG